MLHWLRRSQVHYLFLILAMASSRMMTSASLIAGLSVFAVGLFLQLWSKAALFRNAKLSTQGPYAMCRHPFYLGNAIFDMGLCIMSGYYYLLLLYPPVFYLAYWHVMRAEDANLARLFGEAHGEYWRTTNLFFPKVWRLWKGWQAPASWRNLLAERELSRLCRHCCYPLLVILAARLWHSQQLDAFALLLIGCMLVLSLLRYMVYTIIEQKRKPV